MERIRKMYDVIFLAGFLICWLLLQLVILPRMGVST
jgi:hypothetical protein